MDSSDHNGSGRARTDGESNADTRLSDDSAATDTDGSDVAAGDRLESTIDAARRTLRRVVETLRGQPSILAPTSQAVTVRWSRSTTPRGSRRSTATGSTRRFRSSRSATTTTPANTGTGPSNRRSAMRRRSCSRRCSKTSAIRCCTARTKATTSSRCSGRRSKNFWSATGRRSTRRRSTACFISYTGTSGVRPARPDHARSARRGCLL